MSGDVTGAGTVIVTGGSGFVGAHVATALAGEGYDVVPVDRRATVSVRECDITDQGQVRTLVSALEAEGRTVYGLVNAAALIPSTGLWDVERDEFLSVLDVNAWGSLNIAREACRAMIPHGRGRVVNIASVAGYVGGLVGGPHYAASKAAVFTLTKVLAKELAQHQITVNAVAPGALQSPSTEALDAGSWEALTERIPLGRLGTREEIAHAITFLLSPGAGYMTGATLDVNGGVHFR